jgi:hypothetical protein
MTKKVKKETFYILWVEGSNYPPRAKYDTLADAKAGVEYLIEEKGLKKVHIMKLHSIGKVPTNISYS